MPAVRATLHPYALPLRTPLRLAFGTISERTGVLLRLENDAGHIGWGDGAPLPGFSADTLEAATRALTHWCRTRDASQLTPAAGAAVDGALLDLAAHAAGRTPAQMLGAHPAETVYLAALLTGSDAEVVARAGVVRDAGYRAAKLKVGAATVATDVARVRAVAGALGAGVALRLDANRAWSYDDARRFADALAEVPLAYLEEPLQNPDRLPDLARETALPLALDETLRERAPSELSMFAAMRAVVLKPLVLGGVRRALQWADAARALGMEAVVSGAFESGVGTRHALALAAVLGDTPAGLDPYNMLASDVLSPPLALDGPAVHMRDVFAARAVHP